MHFLLLPNFLHILFSLSFLQLPPSFPARSLVDHPILYDDPSPTRTGWGWGRFTKLANLEKGSHVSGICDLKRYFHHFGYLPPPPPPGNFSDDFDSELESAILNYQRNLGLPVTGKLDPDTIDLIIAPRCGMGDSGHHPNSTANTITTDHPHQTLHFAYFSGQPRWLKSSPMTLTYAFSENHIINYLTRDEIRTVFRRAFSRWSEVIPLNFTEIQNYRRADIRIGFYNGDHGDGEPFDGVLGVLAHAFSPENGRLHLDASERWAVDFKREDSKVAIDLESVATHEIGHVLGLAHSSVIDSIMYPSLRPRSKKVNLRVDDVEGVQALYGSNPNFNYGSLLVSDRDMSNGATRFGGVDGLFRLKTTWWFLTMVLSFWLT